jgi:phospholipid N-methyltransferase
VRPSLVISGLPHYTLSDEHWNVMDTIVKWAAQGTIFRGFSYTPHSFRDVYKWLPIKPKWFVLLNVPPAFVFGIN